MNKIEQLLPGYSCGSCGVDSCASFAQKVEQDISKLDDCPFMSKGMFVQERQLIEDIINSNINEEEIFSLLDKKKCSFVLAPLNDESSCREFILPLNGTKVNIGDYIKWRPLGCPIVHFGGVFEISPLLGVRPQGPRDKFIDVGISMILGFEGTVVKGIIPDVQETVVFLPEYCMMQKAHSGVVVEAKGNMVRIEGIHLAVWDKIGDLKERVDRIESNIGKINEAMK